jgi:hypothetical protein
MLLEALATIFAGLFAGAAVYITLVEHPARLECGTEVALRQFAPSYRRASWMQASLAASGFMTALGASFQKYSVPVLVAGLLLGAVIPFTLLVILPTNQRLLSAAVDRSSQEAAGLLSRWGRLHAVRSVLGVTAFGILVWHLAGTD